MSEVTGRGYQIARATNLPTLIDVDTGFGEPMNLARSLRELEDLGLAACHLEDQVNPKRCGHLDNKEVVETSLMVRRIRAAVDARRDPDFLIVARTDARAVESLDGAIARAKAYADAGADMIFPEALADEAEFAAMRAAVMVPLLANMTEFGKTKLLTREQLSDLGYNLVIYPVTGLRLAMKAVEDGFAEIASQGTQEHLLTRMQHRQRLYELLGYEAYNRFDGEIFNFKL
jgi:methylisocitrate lyase